MDHSSLQTTQINQWVAGILAGNRQAREELFRRTLHRLERLAGLMLKEFPRIGARVETEDVVQNAAMRLLRALESVQPTSVREFHSLAATQIRRELLDLARYFSRNAVSPLPNAADSTDSTGCDWDPAAQTMHPADLDRWCRFHIAVEDLPAEEREAFGLSYYHGWSQADIAELFGVTERTIRRRLQAAMLKLYSTMKEKDLP